MLKTVAIKNFLSSNTHQDLADVYSIDMECQVIINPGRGSKIDGEYKGSNWVAYTDESGQIWKPFRIPYKANTNNPEYIDTDIRFNLEEHAEGIGMTGWNWKDKKSFWVAFDFDAILGHSNKNRLTTNELDEIKQKATEIPWVTVRHSTSGKGIHLYVYLVDITTNNHTEHQALARSILSKMSAFTGFDFHSRVDICGGNMWVWHRKMGDINNNKINGLKLIKKGELLKTIPSNWRDHLEAVNSKTSKHNLHKNFDKLTEQKTKFRLYSEHLRLINWLEYNCNKNWWWDFDRNMLICHTLDLKNAHKDLKLIGLFETETTASSDQNCFAFPQRDGVWVVRRYSLGCSEHEYWDKDEHGWTRCYYNKLPNLKTLAKIFKGVEDPKGGYLFKRCSSIIKVCESLGCKFVCPEVALHRPGKLKIHKDKRLFIEVKKEETDSDTDFGEWLEEKNKWIYMCNEQITQEIETTQNIEVIRHIISPVFENVGWMLKNNMGEWQGEPMQHIKPVLKTMGLNIKEVELTIGSHVLNPWKLVNKPFAPEYPGGSEWNRNSAQLRFTPSTKDKLDFPTWIKLLTHIGKTTDIYINKNSWCIKNNVTSGGEYLKLWIASMIQYPYESLPYLFLHSENQHTGKSTFHEAISLLFSPGVVNADNALTNKEGFNGQLQNAILCVVEEVNLSESAIALNRIKNWVTAKYISLHIKSATPYDDLNTTHWVQCANNISFCPAVIGDTRIGYINVKDKPIYDPMFMSKLEKEAPDFTREILDVIIPEQVDRLRIPVIETSDKAEAMQRNMSPVLYFIKEKLYEAPGEHITISEFFTKFHDWLDPTERGYWSKQKISVQMPSNFVKGRLKTGTWAFGNISESVPKNPNALPYVLYHEKLVIQGEEE